MTTTEDKLRDLADIWRDLSIPHAWKYSWQYADELLAILDEQTEVQS